MRGAAAAARLALLLLLPPLLLLPGGALAQQVRCHLLEFSVQNLLPVNLRWWDGRPIDPDPDPGRNGTAIHTHLSMKGIAHGQEVLPGKNDVLVGPHDTVEMEAWVSGMDAEECKADNPLENPLHNPAGEMQMYMDTADEAPHHEVYDLFKLSFALQPQGTEPPKNRKIHLVSYETPASRSFNIDPGDGKLPSGRPWPRWYGVAVAPVQNYAASYDDPEAAASILTYAIGACTEPTIPYGTAAAPSTSPCPPPAGNCEISGATYTCDWATGWALTGSPTTVCSIDASHNRTEWQPPGGALPPKCGTACDQRPEDTIPAPVGPDRRHTYADGPRSWHFEPGTDATLGQIGEPGPKSATNYSNIVEYFCADSYELKLRHVSNDKNAPDTNVPPQLTNSSNGNSFIRQCLCASTRSCHWSTSLGSDDLLVCKPKCGSDNGGVPNACTRAGDAFLDECTIVEEKRGATVQYNCSHAGTAKGINLRCQGGCNQTCSPFNGGWSWRPAKEPECFCEKGIRRSDVEAGHGSLVDANDGSGTVLSWTCPDAPSNAPLTIQCTGKILNINGGYCCGGEWQDLPPNWQCASGEPTEKDHAEDFFGLYISKCAKDASGRECVKTGIACAVAALLLLCGCICCYRRWCRRIPLNEKDRISVGQIGISVEDDLPNSERFTAIVDPRKSFGTQMHERINRAGTERKKREQQRRLTAEGIEEGLRAPLMTGDDLGGTWASGSSTAAAARRVLDNTDGDGDLGAGTGGHTDPGVQERRQRRLERAAGRSRDPDMIAFSDLEFKGKIGAGSSGVVFAGRLEGSTPCAIKRLNLILDSTSSVQFMSEVKMLTDVKHPNVVLFFGVSFGDEETGDCYLVTEYCQEGCLQDVLESERELSGEQKVSMARDIAVGMAYVHKKGLMHRDLKSANVLVDSGFKLKICDFGISRSIDHMTEMTGSIGTVPWTAPEMLQGTDYNLPVDVYSFGILLWEIVTRQRPYDGLMAPKIIMMVLQGGRLMVPLEGDENHVEGLDCLMEACWNAGAALRPSFEEVVQCFEDFGSCAEILQEILRRRKSAQKK